MIFAAVLVGTAFGEAQRPAQRGRDAPAAQTLPQVPPPRSQEPAGANQHGTEQAPLPVRIVTPPKTEAELAQEQTEREDRKANESWFATLTRGLAIATGGLVIAVIGLWYTAAQQSRQLKQALETARRSADAAEFTVKTMETTAERQQRAYVFVKHVDADAKPQANGQIRQVLRIVWENTGATPTRHMAMSVNWGQFQPDIPTDFHFPDGKQEPSVLGPRQTVDTWLTDIPNDTLVNAAQSSHKLYVWGWVEYNDVFANTPRHRTEFCFRLLVHGEPGTAQCSFGTSRHAKYNATDDDCVKKPSRQLI
jgi:hypothetical protein